VPEPLVLRAGEGEIVTDKPERTLRILTDHELLNLTWFRFEPGEKGPDPHVHHTHTDAFYVLEGEIELRLGPKVESFAAPAGTLGVAPPDVVHSFRNSSDATALFLNVHAPGAGFANMLRARRDGRKEEVEKFDQHDPPADGGRPLADALMTAPGEGGAQDPDGHFSLVEVELAPGSLESSGGLTAVFVLDGTVALGETELAAGDFALITSGAAALRNSTDAAARCAIFTA
jgi:quercetin dioxygenase-like cupin family protein